ncbi:hypothetical protein PMAYCL1PPCAC_26017, partial [Pristionchus mayeri]
MLSLFLSSLFVFAQADITAIYEKPITLKVKQGEDLTINIPVPTSKWYRTFQDGRERQNVEACDSYIKFCEKLRSGELDKDLHLRMVSIYENGTLYMPKVSSTDSAQYFTFYRLKGIYQYSYFD